MKNSFKGYDAGMEREILAQTAYHHEDPKALTSQAQNEYARRDRNMAIDGGSGPEQNTGINPPDQQLGGPPPNPNQGGGGGDGGGQSPPGAPGSPENPQSPQPSEFDINKAGNGTNLHKYVDSINEQLRRNSEVEQNKLGLESFSSQELAQIKKLIIDAYTKDYDSNQYAGQNLKAAQDYVDQIDRIIQEQERAAIKKHNDEISAQREAQGNIYLTPEDVRDLKEKPKEWLNQKFNAIYEDSVSGQPSALIGLYQNQLGYIDQYVDGGREFAIKMRQEFHNRINLLVMRLQIEGKNMDQVKQAAAQLQTRGFLSPMGYEDGRVGALFARMQDKLDDTRLADGGSEKHVTPEFVAKFQDELIEEQIKLARNRTGLWAPKEGETVDEQKIKTDITRSVRTAYDAFVVSTRQALIVSRGRHLSGADAFFSDPIGAFANVYNIEDLATGKFGIFNADQIEFLEEIKLELARDNLAARGLDPKDMDKEEMLTLGTSLFKDMYAVPDFFSSGWRMKGITGQLYKLTEHKQKMQGIKYDEEVKRLTADKHQDYEKKAKEILEKKGDLTPESLEKKILELYKTDRINAESENFALFIRLRQASLTPAANPQREVDMEAAWQKIRDFRAEEIIRLYRDRSPESLEGLAEEFIHNGSVTKADLTNNKGKYQPEKVYDVFKAKYGAIMRSMRDEKMKVVDDKGNIMDFRQLNFGNLTDADSKYVKNQVDKALGPGEGEIFLSLYKTMQDYVDNNSLIYGLIGKSKETIQHAKNSLAAANAQFAGFSDTPEGREAKRKAMSNWQKQYARGYEEFVKTNPRERAIRKKYNEFDGIYTRVLMVDDALLSALEVPPEGSNLTSLSKVYSTDFGGDALVRNMNDTGNADKAGQALRDFIIAEKPEEKAKKAEEFSGSVAAYNGTLPKAQTLRFTLGTYEQLAVSPLFMDVLGFRKLPFRIPTTRLEEIFGPQAMPKSTDERRIVLDHLKSAITANMAELTEDQKHLPIEEQERIIEENKAIAQRWYFDLEKKLKVKKGDIVELKLLQVLLFFLLATGGEAIKMPTDIFQQVASGK